jgi:hypothetical protein
MCHFLCLPKESNQRKGPTNAAQRRARALPPHMPPTAHASLCAAPFVDALPLRRSSMKEFIQLRLLILIIQKALNFQSQKDREILS